MVYKFFDKKTGSGAKLKVSKQPAQELNKLAIKKIQERKRLYKVQR